MFEFVEFMKAAAPIFLPILGALLTVIFTKRYVYQGMVPETLLNSQVEREKNFLTEQADREQTRLTEQADREQTRLKEQADRDKVIVETAKDLEQHLEEIVFQLTSLTEKVSKEISESNARITSLEHYLSDQNDHVQEFADAIKHLSFECEKHRKGIPETT